MSEELIGELTALGAAICWTVSAILYKEALVKTKPISANIVRLGTTSIVLLMFLTAIGKLGVLTSLPAYAVVLACVSGIIGLGFGDTLYLVSLKLVGVSKAVPITCTYPLFNLLWAVLLVGERLTPTVVLGTATIVLGVWLLSYETENTPGQTRRQRLVTGMIAASAAAVLWSISIAMIDKAVTLPETGRLDQALAINTIRVVAIAVVLLVSVPVLDRERGFLRVGRKALATMMFGGMVALGLGWYFLTVSFLSIPESQAVPISSTTPLFSTLTGIFLLREKVTVKNAVGSVIIVLGIFLIFTKLSIGIPFQ
jgi:DME family drug/metabolite transporter